MTAKRIDGKAFAVALGKAVAESAASIRAEHGFTPGLAVVLVGEDPASQVYVASKGRETLAAGMNSFEHKLPAEASEAELLAIVERLNADEAVDGILVQLPLPKHIDTNKVLAAISPDKDVDGFHVINAGRLATGQSSLVPCTPWGSMLLLKATLGSLAGLEAVVVGRSNIVGKPIAQLLLAADCTVTIAHSRTKDLAAVCRRADILIAAVGRPEMISGDWLKPGVTVIDVGINRVPAPEKGEGKTKLVGDVAFAEALEVAGAITPVPGGVGPMTIASLLANTLTAAMRRRGLPEPTDFAAASARLMS
jgi:methylenetetrahydrofolate dehydrogenase (NADP+)/methenyltetrahydrofolate cyclohydrolase